MKIYDTLTATEKELDTADKVRIYLCGVTVYDESHIGHARTIIIFDVLRRYLESKGIKLQFIQNFTDVDDKIINRAQKENLSAEDISEKYILHYFEDFDRLNVKRASLYPKATDHIDDMIKFIQKLIENNIAYVSKNGVYYAVSKFSTYGKLSKKKTDDLLAGARVEVDEAKNDPLDFALWKLSDIEPTWDSPWGKGRPGWHIECSAMSTKYLGETLEIHGGGRDLIFPHHENEIAQSEAFTGKNFAKIWMHVGMVTINGEKMSKSLGNIRSVRHVLDNWGPNIIRLFCLSGHYSKPIDYSEELLKENLIKWRQIETCHYELVHAQNSGNTDSVTELVSSCDNEFDAAIESDFNTHMALTVFFKLVKEANSLAAIEKLTKDDAIKIQKSLQRMRDVLGLVIPELKPDEKKKIDQMITSREELRRQKKYPDADKIREQLNEMSIELIDHKSRTIWMKKEKIKSDLQEFKK